MIPGESAMADPELSPVVLEGVAGAGVVSAIVVGAAPTGRGEVVSASTGFSGTASAAGVGVSSTVATAGVVVARGDELDCLGSPA